MKIDAAEVQNSVLLKGSEFHSLVPHLLHREEVGGQRKPSNLFSSMAQLILTRNTQFHRALRVSGTFPLTLRVGRFFLLFSMTLMIGLLSFFYLIKFTTIHTQGSHLRKLELKTDDLEGEQDSKNLQIAEQKSLEEIKESSVTAGMIPAQNVVYIREDGTVATLPGISGRP